MVTAVNGYVDPPPVRVPSMGLLASANNVVVGNDYDSPDRVNPTDVESDVGGTGTVPVTGSLPSSDYETPREGGAPVRWISGFSFIPELCNGGDRIDREGGAAGTVPALPAAADVINVRPYIVEGVDRRSTFGTPAVSDYLEARQRARRQLLGCEGKQIEAELWTGKLSDGSSSTNRHLTSADVDLVEGDRLLGSTTALATLERAIKDGTCNQQGMIHARADTIAIWDMGGALRRVGNLILTIHDTIVVPGAGYTGSAPDTGTVSLDPAHASSVPSTDSAWAYATTIVDVRRSAFMSPQTMLERVDYQHNTLTTYERRIAAATWGCLHVGVHVDHINAISTTGS